ncbi:uncharacterized protein LOC131676169 [Topomyia yanbarensis]|uniref:uncharacterized protein LOC131676169 n=1 Tax=Topomyia yanbarensis TaxID=2498891 RepID=UPI00273C0CF4|nr:uncharacterized protein LOC131676169 [Topomyia yanbarensis]
MTQLQTLLEEQTANLQTIRTEYEHNLKHFYSMKAKEYVLGLHIETWKQLCQKQDAELVAQQREAAATRTEIWNEREAFCTVSSQFANDFSLDNTLAALQRVDHVGDTPAEPAHCDPNKPDAVASPHSSKMEEIEQEIQRLREKEAELNRMEQEMVPDEETIRLLQEAVNKSAINLEELEAGIQTLDDNELPSQDDEVRRVKSILKRPSFVVPDVDRKQVRFE